MAKDTAHRTQHIERAHRGTGTNRGGIPHTQQNTLRGHTGEQEPSGQGHRTHNTTHRAGTRMNRSQLANNKDTTQHTERAHW